MARAGWLISGGAIAGGSAVLMLMQVFPPGSSSGITTGWPAVPGEPLSGESVPAPDAFVSAVASYEQIARIERPEDTEAEMARVAARPHSVRRDTELTALLNGLAASDPAAAVELAEQLELGADVIARLFRSWAEIDADGALSQLQRLQPAATRRTAALALLDVFGLTPAGIDIVSVAFSPVDAASFRIDAIGRMAERDPSAALAAAEALDISQAQTIAQQRIASVMARIDPHTGFEYADSIPIALQRRRYMERLLDDWAKLDPDAMMAFLETADFSEMAVSEVSFQALAMTGPERLLSLADRFAPELRIHAQNAALAVLGALDPTNAYERVQSLPPTGDRDQLIQGIAQRYAEQDPEGAILWATSLQPRSPAALNAVLSGVAATDPVRAADAVIADILNPASANIGEVPMIASVLSAAMRAQSREMADVADVLHAHADARVKTQLTMMLQLWPQADPQSAVEWITQNPSALSSDVAMTFAQQVAAQDSALAAQVTGRIPQHARDQWIAGAASGMARSDFDDAMRWIGGFEGDPAYDNAIQATLRSAAAAQPEAVARYLETNSAYAGDVAAQVAVGWAARDPVAAAAWADGLSDVDTAVRGNVVFGVTARWAGLDASAAEQWVFGMPAGPPRDRGLAALLIDGAGTGTVETRLLEAFSSSQARAEGLVGAMPMLGSTNRELGQQLIDRHISDPAMRTRAETALEAGARQQTMFVGGQQIIIMDGVPGGVLLR